MSTARQNVISVTLGRKGSGKSHYVRRRWCDHEPRLITLDFTGEAPEQDPGAPIVYDMAQAARTFATLLRAHVREWHVIVQMPAEKVPELFGVLVPVDMRAKGLSRAFGGIAITCDELSLVAPLHGTPDTVRNALMIGRHHGLSQHYATQRPQNIAGAVKGQADFVTCFRMHERHERKWIADTVGSVAAHVVPELPPYHFLEYDTAAGVLVLQNGDDRVLHRADVGILNREFEQQGRAYQMPGLSRQG